MRDTRAQSDVYLWGTLIVIGSGVLSAGFTLVHGLALRGPSLGLLRDTWDGGCLGAGEAFAAELFVGGAVGIAVVILAFGSALFDACFRADVDDGESEVPSWDASVRSTTIRSRRSGPRSSVAGRSSRERDAAAYDAYRSMVAERQGGPRPRWFAFLSVSRIRDIWRYRDAFQNRRQFLADDPPAFCLYLRDSAWDDMATHNFLPVWGGVYDEAPRRPAADRLRGLMRRQGLVLVGLVKPQENMWAPPYRPVLAHGDHWQGDVRELMQRATLIAFDVQGLGPGLRWELDVVTGEPDLLDKTVLVVKGGRSGSLGVEGLTVDDFRWVIDLGPGGGPGGIARFQLPRDLVETLLPVERRSR